MQENIIQKSIQQDNVFSRINAFTLIELLVVIAIIGILSGLIIVGMNEATNSANDAKRKANIDTIRKALLIYQANNGGLYPTGINEALGCTINGGTTPCSVLSSALGDLLPNPPTDPAGSFYVYRSNGSDFTISSTLSNSYPYNYYSVDGFNTGLVGNWPMNEGTGSTIINKAGIGTGTISGGATWVSNRLSFDGNSGYVSIGNSSTYKPKNFTVSLWFNSNDLGGVAYSHALVGNGSDCCNGFGISCGGNVVWFWVGSGASPRKNEMTSPVVVNTWYNLVATYNEGSGSKLYLNGVLKNGSSVFTGSLVYDTNDFNIGRLYGVYYYFNGKIDNLRIYNRALPLTEVVAIYDAQKANH